MSYRTLGSRRGVGSADTTGLNAGNWTVTFDPEALSINVPSFEVYKMVVKGAVGSTFDVYVDIVQWDSAVRGDLNSWDPNQPLELNPGQSVYFLWSDPVSDGTPPVVVLWLRYDDASSQNRSVA